MKVQMFRDTLGWGILLWLIGYLIGILLFALVPVTMIGWVIMPIGIVITLWVLLRKIQGGSLANYLLIAAVWTLIAVVFDYFFLVKLLKPADGYYKLDVYLYYAITFALPLIVGFAKRAKSGGDRTTS
jgi:hypothetical protein